MTHDEALIEECNKVWMEWKETRNIQGSSLQYVQFIKLLVAFAKRQRASGVREVAKAFQHRSDALALDVHNWCESRAKELGAP